MVQSRIVYLNGNALKLKVRIFFGLSNVLGKI
jgi:hypothetical protein